MASWDMLCCNSVMHHRDLLISWFPVSCYNYRQRDSRIGQFSRIWQHLGARFAPKDYRNMYRYLENEWTWTFIIGSMLYRLHALFILSKMNDSC